MCAPQRTIYVDFVAGSWQVAQSDLNEPRIYPRDAYGADAQECAWRHANFLIDADADAELRACALSRPEDLAPPRPDRPDDGAPGTQWLPFPCTRCGETDPMGWIRAIDGNLICGECEESHYLNCRHCHRTTPADEPGLADHDHIPDDVCVTCFESHSSECSGCAETYHDDDLTNGLCESCQDTHWTCSRCDDVHHEYHTSYESDDGSICQSCYERHYFTCDSCDGVFRNGHYSHNGLCGDCASDCSCDDCTNGDRGEIWQDSAVDALGFVGPKPNDMLWLGVELELEVSGDIDGRAEDMADAFGRDFIVVKEDGSLSHGFEVNTAPSSLDTHRARWESAHPELPSGIKSWDTTTCGIHIHADRRALTEFGWGKVICLMCAPENIALFECIAGRSRSAVYATVNDGPKPTHGKRDKRGIYGRYSWINTQPTKTVEFRLFKGTTDKIGYMKNVECIHAVATYCRSAGLSQLTAGDFLAWLDAPARRKQYPALATFLGRNGHLRTITPAPTPDEIERRRMESKARKLAARAALFVQAS